MSDPPEIAAELPSTEEEAPPQRRWRISMTSALLIAVFVYSFTLPVRFESPIPLCLMYAITDVPCALCGMSRATVCLAHGQVADAVRYHPGVLILMPTLALVLFGSLRRDLTGKRPGRYWRKATRVVEWVTLVTILGYGAGRALLVLALGIEPW